MQNEEYVKIKIRFNIHTVAVILILFSSYFPDFKHFCSWLFDHQTLRLQICIDCYNMLCNECSTHTLNFNRRPHL